MTDHHCRWAGPTQPRLLRTHQDDCDASGCPGCQPCPERHCQLCGHEHVTVDGQGHDQTCATCIGATRDDLTAVVTLSGRLLEEATHRGIRSEAAHLAGPATNTTDDFEAWRNREMSAAMDRIPSLPADDGLHPLWVLGTWETLIREHYDQPSNTRITIPTARRYLASHLARLAHDPDFGFDELAADVRRCRTHLEDVLRDGDREERGVRCPPCGRAHLVKSYGKQPDDDRWTCPRCKQWWTESDYRTKVKGIFVGVATALTDADMESRTRVRAATVRQWARRDLIRRRGKSDDGRQLYDVDDVIRVRDARARA